LPSSTPGAIFHAHLRERAEAVKRGILQAGGFPFELPAMSLGEVMVKPTTMLYRNLLAMECEELLRSHPIDGAVLMGGCDKTTPGLLMGAISMDIPAIYCPAGSMLNDRYRGKTVGAGTHTKKFYDEYVAGNIEQREWIHLESKMTRAPGTCNTMGTASTMTAIAEAMGFCLPGATSVPAMDANHERMAAACGRRAVEMVWEDLKPSAFFTRDSVDNGIAVYMALGGSTNAAIHTIAMAGRAGIKLTLADLDEAAGKIPVIANLFPSGDKLMEDFYYAGGLPALMNEVRQHLKLNALTVTAKSLGENISGATNLDAEVIRPLTNPVTTGRALAVLRGNLCQDGAIIKPSAADPRFMKHRGRAMVFDSNDEMLAKVYDPNIDVDANTVMVLRNAGPVGAPGMPEWGNLPIPRKLLQQGVRDMVRISDARMSGTHYGSCIVHVAPEAAVGGAIALVRDGDWICLDVDARTLNVEVSDEELKRRRTEWKPPKRYTERGFTRLYIDHVTQADQGCDFDFLMGTAPTPEPPIY
jgi:dihydroxy-acid dehydratase